MELHEIEARCQIMFRAFFCVAVLLFIGCASRPVPDLGRAQQNPFSPGLAEENCAGYFEARFEFYKVQSDEWDSVLYTKAFFDNPAHPTFGPIWTSIPDTVRLGTEPVPYAPDTEHYRSGEASTRNGFFGTLKNWEPLQVWTTGDKEIGTFRDSISSPNRMRIIEPTGLLRNDSLLEQTGFTITYTSPGSDSVWVDLLRGVFPVKGQPAGLYTNEGSYLPFYYVKVPATGTFIVTPAMMAKLKPNDLIGVRVVAQTAKISEHHGNWYFYRSTSIAAIANSW